MSESEKINLPNTPIRHGGVNLKRQPHCPRQKPNVRRHIHAVLGPLVDEVWRDHLSFCVLADGKVIFLLQIVYQWMIGVESPRRPFERIAFERVSLKYSGICFGFDPLVVVINDELANLAKRFGVRTPDATTTEC